MRIKTGDNVKVLSGKDRGKTGKVIQVLFNKAKNQHFVVIEGVNVLKKHMRSGKQGEKGQVIELPAPIHASNVQLIDAASGKPSRVTYRVEGKTKKRVAHKSGEFID